MNFYPIYKNKKLLPWIKWWILKGNKIAPKHLSEWINSASAITLTGVYKGSPLLNLNLNGNTSQTGTPTPEAPVPVNVVKGNNTIKINDTDYQVNLKSKNLFNKDTVSFTIVSGMLKSDTFALNGTYTLSSNILYGTTYANSSEIFLVKEGESANTSANGVLSPNVRPYTCNGNYTIQIRPQNTNASQISSGEKWIMLQEGSQATPYEPYYDYELCKIGDSQDVIYKENNKWYVDKYIEKVVLNGSESWSTRTGGTTYAYTLSNFFDSSNREGLCDYFKYVRAGASNTQNTECIASAGTNKTLNIFTNNTNLDTVSNLKTWLSTHNTSVYYVLSTSETTEITETNLINQLEAIYNAKLQSGTNTITQTPSNLPFYLNFQYYEKG